MSCGPIAGRVAGELRRFLIAGEDLGVCWSADNSRRTAGIRGTTEDRGEDENCAGSPAGPPSTSVNSRPHMTMMACPRSTRGPHPECRRVAPLPGVTDKVAPSTGMVAARYGALALLITMSGSNVVPA